MKKKAKRIKKTGARTSLAKKEAALKELRPDDPCSVLRALDDGMGRASLKEQLAARIRHQPPTLTSGAWENAEAEKVLQQAEALRSRKAAQRSVVQLRDEAVPLRKRVQLISQIVEDALASRDLGNQLPFLIDVIRRVSPEGLKSYVTKAATSGLMWSLTEVHASGDKEYALAAVLRASLIQELELGSVCELAVLDCAMHHWAEARRLQRRAEAACRSGAEGSTDRYAKLIKAGQAADRLFVSLIQGLRDRRRPTIRSMSIHSGDNTAIQINEGPHLPDAEGGTGAE